MVGREYFSPRFNMSQQLRFECFWRIPLLKCWHHFTWFCHNTKQHLISLLKKHKKMKELFPLMFLYLYEWNMLFFCFYFYSAVFIPSTFTHIILAIWYHLVLLLACHILHLSNNYSQEHVKVHLWITSIVKQNLNPTHISIYTPCSWVVKFTADLRGLPSFFLWRITVIHSHTCHYYLLCFYSVFLSYCSN